MKNAQRPTLEDVAKAMDVSIATVSRALNGSSLVRDELRLKIQKTAERLGYLADASARALVLGRSGAIGAIVPTLRNSMFTLAVDAFQQRLEEHQYTLLLSSFDYDPEKEYQQARMMLERGVDALMLVGATRDRRFYAMLESRNVPFVQGWALPKLSRYPAVGYDNAKLSEQVIEHLVGLGHRRIGLVVQNLAHNDRVAARISGISRALKKRDLTLPPERIVHRPASVEDGKEALREFQSRGELPTAIVAGNDVLAYGILFEALAQGIAVPDELSIVGHGDMGLAAHLTPQLTTVRTPKVLIGQLCANYLIATIAHQPFKLPQELSFELMVRGTTGAASKRTIQARTRSVAVR